MALTIQKQVDLRAYNTMGVPAVARYFAEISAPEHLDEALDFARKQRLEVFILGEGSNTIFAGDFQGLVLLCALKGIEIIRETEESVDIRVAAGENWHEFVSYCVERSWNGLENLALIPGLVGAAPIQNIGAYGAELKDSLISLKVVSLSNAEHQKLNNIDCQFGYRDSIFKRDLAAKVMVLSVDLRLHKSPRVNIEYPALATAFKATHANELPLPNEVFSLVCEIRSQKLPCPQQIPNSGSFFKNPIVTKSQASKLRQSFPDLVSYPAGDEIKIAAAWLIEKAGWKGRAIDGVIVHQNQALVVTNPLLKNGKTVLAFAKEVQQDILKKFGLSLEIEPKVV